MAFVCVARVDSIAPGKGAQFEAGGRKIAVFRSAAGVHAIDALCPHRNAPLAGGECDGRTVTCPWHIAKFDVASGQAVSGPTTVGLTTYRAEIRGSKIYVDVPGAKPSWWRRLLGGY